MSYDYDIATETTATEFLLLLEALDLGNPSTPSQEFLGNGISYLTV